MRALRPQHFRLLRDAVARIASVAQTSVGQDAGGTGALTNFSQCATLPPETISLKIVKPSAARDVKSMRAGLS